MSIFEYDEEKHMKSEREWAYFIVAPKHASG